MLRPELSPLFVSFCPCGVFFFSGRSPVFDGGCYRPFSFFIIGVFVDSFLRESSLLIALFFRSCFRVVSSLFLVLLSKLLLVSPAGGWQTPYIVLW